MLSGANFIWEVSMPETKSGPLRVFCLTPSSDDEAWASWNKPQKVYVQATSDFHARELAANHPGMGYTQSKATPPAERGAGDSPWHKIRLVDCKELPSDEEGEYVFEVIW